MKNSIAGLELHYLLKELQVLKDARLDKIYQSEKKELLMSFHVTGKGKQLLKIMAGSYLYLTEYKDVAQEPTSFCMFLRKQLGNARLRSIEQVGEERIVKLEFLAGDEKQLYIELFGKGNIILCDSSDVILGVEETQRWTDRTVKKGEKYKHPTKEVMFTNITKKNLMEMAEKSKDSIVKMLAAGLGLGGVYAEEVCIISEVDKNKKAKDIEDKEAKAIAAAIKEITSKDLAPVGIYKDGILVEALPFPLQAYEEAEQKKFESYSSLLDSIFTEAAVKTKEKGKTKLYDQKIQKIQKIIDVQEKRISELLDEYEKNSEKGNKLYEHYQVVDSIIKQLNKAWKEKTFEEIKEKLKGHKIIKDVKRKGEVVVELK